MVTNLDGNRKSRVITIYMRGGKTGKYGDFAVL
jgi:hypothetical protein